jgi:RNA polymerase sigma factor (sigma-70 family)
MSADIAADFRCSIRKSNIMPEEDDIEFVPLEAATRSSGDAMLCYSVRRKGSKNGPLLSLFIHPDLTMVLDLEHDAVLQIEGNLQRRMARLIPAKTLDNKRCQRRVSIALSGRAIWEMVYSGMLVAAFPPTAGRTALQVVSSNDGALVFELPQPGRAVLPASAAPYAAEALEEGEEARGAADALLEGAGAVVAESVADEEQEAVAVLMIEQSAAEADVVMPANDEVLAAVAETPAVQETDAELAAMVTALDALGEDDESASAEAVIFPQSETLEVRLTKHEGWVWKMAHYWHGRNPTVALEDLAQEGRLGIIHAHPRFQESFGANFLTFARHHINQRMRLFVHWTCDTIRVPDGKFATARIPTFSLDAPCGENGDMRMMDMIAAPEAEEQLHEQGDVMELMNAALAELPERDRQILKDLYIEGKTLREIGESLGITHQGVFQIRERSLNKLRSSKHFKKAA